MQPVGLGRGDDARGSRMLSPSRLDGAADNYYYVPSYDTSASAAYPTDDAYYYTQSTTNDGRYAPASDSSAYYGGADQAPKQVDAAGRHGYSYGNALADVYTASLRADIDNAPEGLGEDHSSRRGAGVPGFDSTGTSLLAKTGSRALLSQ